MALPENKDHLQNPVMEKLRIYVEQRLKEMPTEPNTDFPDIEETAKIPIIHDEVSSVQFYKVHLGYELPGGTKSADYHIGMRLNHKPRTASQPGDKDHNITTDLDFATPQSSFDGTYTNIREPDDTFVAEIVNTGGAYELVFSVLDCLHRQYPEQFPDTGSIFTPQ